MLTSLRRLLYRSRHLIIAHHLYEDWRSGRRLRSGKYERAAGSRHSQLGLDQSLQYIDDVFEDYLTYSALEPESIVGARILEVGPGDSFGVALKFLAAGARSVTCLDRYYSERDQQQQQRIYRAMRERMSPEEQDRFDQALQLNGEMAIDPERLLYVYGVPIEQSPRRLPSESFDLIVSRAVLEHVYDCDQAFAAMDQLLAAGGLMAHKVDFRDHGMFSARGHHPLTFLTISDGTYRRMSRNSGRPNRRLIDYYRAKLVEMAYESELLVTQVLGVGELKPHQEVIEAGKDYHEATLVLVRKVRPRLNRRFQQLSDEELAITGVFLSARKP